MRKSLAQAVAEIKANGVSFQEAHRNRAKMVRINIMLERRLGRRATMQEILAELDK